jgi:hypothetical protein
MAENRKGIHHLARQSGLSYQEVKHIVFEIVFDTPDAEEGARRLALCIQTGSN